MKSKYASALFQFIEKSPTAFQAVDSVCDRLHNEGFTYLNEHEKWQLTPGKGYYLTRNHSSVIAFRIPEGNPTSFLISASHTDSPMFKLKPLFEAPGVHAYMRLNTEVYGGTILSSWLDRPLSLAGRVIIRRGEQFRSVSVCIDKDLLLIPNVSIHFNRAVNSGYTFNPAVDMLPLFTQGDKASGKLLELVANAADCTPDEIVGTELYVYNRMKPTAWGASEEFFSAPRIDNLMCAFGTLEGFIAAQNNSAITVYFSADNEETGSATKQGAGSVLLSDVLDRICEQLGLDKRTLLASSMMVSADNAHAKHPNHPELSDANNAPLMNAGIVIKSNASQKYATDGMALALFAEICKRCNVPYQFFANRSDMPGGSTLGSISNTRVPLLTVDIGMAQLAMHSAYETAGCMDVDYLVSAMTEFYSSTLCVASDGNCSLENNKKVREDYV
jgi:aspartyl aminopeptidase